MKQILLSDKRFNMFLPLIFTLSHHRFASLSVNTGINDSMFSRTATPMYPELSPAMSHTYINQYAGSEYHLDRVQTPQMPYMPFEIDTGYEDYNHSMYQNAGYDNDFLGSVWINIAKYIIL